MLVNIIYGTNENNSENNSDNKTIMMNGITFSSISAIDDVLIGGEVYESQS